MIHGRMQPPKGSSRPRSSDRPLRDRLFAWKLLAGLGGGLAVCFLLYLIPTIYFVEQNYGIFTRLAYDVQPSLVEHLEKEIRWLRLFFAVGSFGTLLVSFFLARKVIRHLLTPLEKMEDHLQKMTSGDWNSSIGDLPMEETYRTLFLTYGYFHRSLKMQARHDLQLLQKIASDPGHREAAQALTALIKTQKTRLGELTSVNDEGATENAEESSAISISRRVS